MRRKTPVRFPGEEMRATSSPYPTETKDQTPLEKRSGRRHKDRPQVWWLSPDDPGAAAPALVRRRGSAPYRSINFDMINPFASEMRWVAGRYRPPTAAESTAFVQVSAPSDNRLGPDHEALWSSLTSRS